MSIAKKEQNPVEPPRVRESTPSGVQIKGGAARPLAAPRRSISQSDVEWWAESTLNSTFDTSHVGPVDPSHVGTIEDPDDPSHGDRITPVFLESITPVFPESKVREVMALADAVERASSVTMKSVPEVLRPALANAAVPAMPAVTTHPVKFAAPLVQAPPASAPIAPAASARAPAAPAPIAPPKVRREVGPAAAPARPVSRVPLLPDLEEPDGMLHALALGTAGGRDVSVALWIAVGLVLFMVWATMFTVG